MRRLGISYLWPLTAACLIVAAGCGKHEQDHDHGNAHHDDRGAAGHTDDTHSAKPNQTEIPADANGIWAGIDRQMSVLREIIEERQLEKVHHVAFEIRDLARALPGVSDEIVRDDSKRKQMNGIIQRIGVHAENLDRFGDNNDLDKTRAEFEKLKNRLQRLRALYPEALAAAGGTRVGYMCPMKCEGDTSYLQAGKCPVCRMALTQVKLSGTPGGHRHKDPTAADNYRLTFKTVPPQPVAGKSVELTFAVTDHKTGKPVTAFKTVHEELNHLIVVSDDLAHFDHLHPVLGEGGLFRIRKTFPWSGSFKLWTDVTPVEGRQVLRSFVVDVSGSVVHSSVALEVTPLTLEATAIPDSALLSRKSDIDEPETEKPRQYKIRFSRPGKLVVGRSFTLSFSVHTAGGKAVTDLRPWLGARGHLVIISQDLKEFLHSHPEGDAAPDWKGGPRVSFHTEFPKPGLYKAWPQFAHGNAVITTGFVIEVK